MPKLTIVVPVFNGGGFLRHCLKSIQNQSFKDFECLLIDDGSTDDSSSVCDQFCQNDQRFSYFKKANGGQAEARNYGMRLAKGEFVTFVDQDDLIHRDMYKILIDDATNNASAVSACSFAYDCRDYEAIEAELNNPRSASCLEVFRSSGEALLAICRKRECVGKVIWNKIYRRDILEDMVFEKEAGVADDVVFTFNLFKKDFVSTYRNEPFYRWVQHKTNQSKTSATGKYKGALAYSKLLARMETEPPAVKDDFRRDYLNLLMWGYGSACMDKKNNRDMMLDIVKRLKTEKKGTEILNAKSRFKYMVITTLPVLYPTLVRLGRSFKR